MRRAPNPALVLTAAALTLAGCGDSRPAGEGASAPVAAPAGPAVPPPPNTPIGGLTGDIERGRRVFVQCRSCHVLEPGVNRIGPTLHGVIGRAAGSVPGFRYSPANRDSDIVWSPERLSAYLENPRRDMPGTYMSFVGVRDPQQRADVIAYIRASGG